MSLITLPVKAWWVGRDAGVSTGEREIRLQVMNHDLGTVISRNVYHRYELQPDNVMLVHCVMLSSLL